MKKQKLMKLKNEKGWNSYVANNTDPYGEACIRVAHRVMELLEEDETPLHNGYAPDIHTAHGLMCKADKDTKAGGITGFMAGCVAEMVFQCHERGDEFRKSHNGDNMDIETDGVINHALLTVRG